MLLFRLFLEALSFEGRGGWPRIAGKGLLVSAYRIWESNVTLYKKHLYFLVTVM